MVGMSHAALRAVVHSYMPKNATTFWPTEMLSSWRLPREVRGGSYETTWGDEAPLVPQILGNEEGPIRESVERLGEWGAAGVDINMGCPVSKALKHNYGVALMGDAGYAREVVRMTVRSTSMPVSVKLRAGLQGDLEFLREFVLGLEDAGAAWMTLHPRLGHMKRRGQADWSQIKFVREHVSLPVVGNGDVQCVADVWQMLDETGCDAVMVGRGLAARPWLMWQVGERLGFEPPEGFEGRRAPATPEEEGLEYGRALLMLLRELRAKLSYEDAVKRLRFHVRMTQGWLEFGQHLFSVVTKAKSFEELDDGIAKFFEVEQRMVARTQLRE